MRLRQTPVIIAGTDGPIRILRNAHGIPEITAATLPDAMHGLGWVHANDRQLQTLLNRILVQGRAAELLKADDALIAVDTHMRRMNFLPDPAIQLARLQADTRRAMEAYADGFNQWMADNGPSLAFRMLGYGRPEPYTVIDCLRLGKVFGFFGLAEVQADMEKFLLEMIQNGVGEAKIRELFPYLTDSIDAELIRLVALAPSLLPAELAWMDRLPRFSASNNWAVSGRHTRSGFPILCGDPHLEVNRLPNIWQEVVVRLPEDSLIGVTLPGLPGILLGRNRYLAWSATFAYMDMLDYRIERCQGGHYYRESGWQPFAVREERILIKGREPVTLRVYENENGLLEGDPHISGHYLVQAWSGASGCGARDFDTLIAIMTARNVQTGMALFRQMETVAMNWVLADTRGNIGYQMSGRHFRRPDGISGLLAHAAWEPRFDPHGFNDPEDLPTVFNPPEGIIATANQDLNYLGRSQPITLAMGPYRVDRIVQLLERTERLDVAYMQDMQYDLYSLQAERLMKTITPLLPDTENGRMLKAWDLRYPADSVGAMLFESVYRAIIDVVFGDHGLGRQVVAHIFSQTRLFNDYYSNLDRILLRPTSAWFDGASREALFRQGIDAGLAVRPVPYGKTRQITLTHLLFGGKLPRFLGIDVGPLTLPGSRATIPQGQIFRHGGRLATFSPTYRFIADLATDEIHTNLAGGPTERPFSSGYVRDLKNWYEGNYKVLR